MQITIGKRGYISRNIDYTTPLQCLTGLQRQSTNNEQFKERLINSVSNQCKGFEIHYQPIIELQNQQVYGCEALLRWGGYSPAEFVPILEETGYIEVVGKWVIDKAFKQLKEWQRVRPDFHMNINTSYKQYKDDFIDYIQLKLEEYRLSGNTIVIEITESCEIQDIMALNTDLERLRSIGVQIALDDFGTGHHSMEVLQRLRIDWIKVAPTFTLSVAKKLENSIVDGIIKISKENNIKVCVEGVENASILNKIAHYKPNTVQGFYYDKAINSQDFTQKYII